MNSPCRTNAQIFVLLMDPSSIQEEGTEVRAAGVQIKGSLNG